MTSKPQYNKVPPVSFPHLAKCMRPMASYMLPIMGLPILSLRYIGYVAIPNMATQGVKCTLILVSSSTDASRLYNVIAFDDVPTALLINYLGGSSVSRRREDAMTGNRTHTKYLCDYLVDKILFSKYALRKLPLNTDWEFYGKVYKPVFCFSKRIPLSQMFLGNFFRNRSFGYVYKSCRIEKASTHCFIPEATDVRLTKKSKRVTGHSGKIAELRYLKNNAAGMDTDVWSAYMCKHIMKNVLDNTVWEPVFPDMPHSVIFSATKEHSNLTAHPDHLGAGGIATKTHAVPVIPKKQSVLSQHDLELFVSAGYFIISLK